MHRKKGQIIKPKDQGESKKWIELYDFRSVKLLPPKLGKFDKLPSEIHFKIGSFLCGEDFFSLFGKHPDGNSATAKELWKKRSIALRRYSTSDHTLKTLSSEYWSSDELRKKAFEIIRFAEKINETFRLDGKAPIFRDFSALISKMGNWVKSLEDNNHAEMGKNIANQIIYKKNIGRASPSNNAGFRSPYASYEILEQYRSDLRKLKNMITPVWSAVVKIDKFLSFFANGKEPTMHKVSHQSSDKDDANEAAISPTF